MKVNDDKWVSFIGQNEWIWKMMMKLMHFDESKDDGWCSSIMDVK
jgi:hypothetical protein